MYDKGLGLIVFNIASSEKLLQAQHFKMKQLGSLGKKQCSGLVWYLSIGYEGAMLNSEVSVV